MREAPLSPPSSDAAAVARRARLVPAMVSAASASAAWLRARLGPWRPRCRVDVCGVHAPPRLHRLPLPGRGVGKGIRCMRPRPGRRDRNGLESVAGPRDVSPSTPARAAGPPARWRLRAAVRTTPDCRRCMCYVFAVSGWPMSGRPMTTGTVEPARDARGQGLVRGGGGGGVGSEVGTCAGSRRPGSRIGWADRPVDSLGFAAEGLCLTVGRSLPCCGIAPWTPLGFAAGLVEARALAPGRIKKGQQGPGQREQCGPTRAGRVDAAPGGSDGLRLYASTATLRLEALSLEGPQGQELSPGSVSGAQEGSKAARSPPRASRPRALRRVEPGSTRHGSLAPCRGATSSLDVSWSDFIP
jgi:hypothetical protein